MQKSHCEAILIDFCINVKELNIYLGFHRSGEGNKDGRIVYFRGYDVPAVRREAKAEEHDTLLIRKVCIKLEKGKTMEQMADELEEDMETITKIYSAIEQAGTHDATEVYEMMNRKQKSCS